jgi:hypothetical protein
VRDVAAMPELPAIVRMNAAFGRSRRRRSAAKIEPAAVPGFERGD